TRTPPPHHPVAPQIPPPLNARGGPGTTPTPQCRTRRQHGTGNQAESPEYPRRNPPPAPTHRHPCDESHPRLSHPDQGAHTYSSPTHQAMSSSTTHDASPTAPHAGSKYR